MKLVVVRHGGDQVEIEGTTGRSAMEAIRAANLEMRAECLGSVTCATCHVYVDDRWIDRLPPPDDVESDLIDMAFAVTETSRLSCQIVLQDALDGLRVTLAPGIE